MGGFTQCRRTTHTGQGRSFPGPQGIESQGGAGVNLRCHNLPGGDPNHTTLPLDMTDTDKVRNAKVNNQGRGYIRQENTEKDVRAVTQKDQEQEARAPTASTTNKYTQYNITAWVIGTRLPQQKETTQKN